MSESDRAIVADKYEMLLSLRDDTIEALRAELAQARADLAERDARIAMVMGALESIGRDDCGCWPCVGQCRSESAIRIWKEDMQERARDTIATLPEQAKRLMELADAAGLWFEEEPGSKTRLHSAVWKFRSSNLSRPDGDGPAPQAPPDVVEDEEVVAIVAHGIAEEGFGRPWDDFHVISIEDTDQCDLEEYAKAAIAALQAAGYVIRKENGK